MISGFVVDANARRPAAYERARFGQAIVVHVVAGHFARVAALVEYFAFAAVEDIFTLMVLVRFGQTRLERDALSVIVDGFAGFANARRLQTNFRAWFYGRVIFHFFARYRTRIAALVPHFVVRATRVFIRAMLVGVGQYSQAEENRKLVHE